ncbi:hypothetical protein OHS81_21955 [Streptomyces sp. NBC_00400]|uniref:hypothetical protein n=1 Tax=Streptomyces sp. NBC_00400 TaxID=2975737 RepID=UPI002E20001D
MTRIRTRLATVAATLALSGGAVVAAAPAASATSAKSACWRAVVTAEDYAGQAASHATAGHLDAARDLAYTAISYTFGGDCESNPAITDIEDARRQLNNGVYALDGGDGEGASARFHSAVYELEQASYVA